MLSLHFIKCCGEQEQQRSPLLFILADKDYFLFFPPPQLLLFPAPRAAFEHKAATKALSLHGE